MGMISFMAVLAYIVFPIVVLAVLYFIMKLAVKNGIKEALNERDWK